MPSNTWHTSLPDKENNAYHMQKLGDWGNNLEPNVRYIETGLITFPELSVSNTRL